MLYQLLVILVVILPQIPGDCPPQCDCKWKSGKESVICINGNLTKIPPNLESGTQIIDLTGNQIISLGKDAFKIAGLLNLQKIFVAKCRVRSIDRFAFRKLINLVELDLSYNSLTAVPSHIFDSISELRELKLSGNPIQRVLNEAFINVPQLVKLELSDCKLGTVEPRAFSGLEHTLEWLKLDKNRIVDIKSNTLTSLLNLHGLELSGNPWNCSCALRELRLWIMTQNIPSSIQASCKYPQRISGKTWDRLEPDEFACNPGVSPTVTKVQSVEGSNVSMSCSVSGNPEPSVKWIWKKRPIANMSTAGKKLYVIGQVEGLSTLTIASVDSSDSGVYLCVASNKAGKVESNVTVSVAKRILENRVSSRVILAGGVVTCVLVLASFALFCCLGAPRKPNRSGRRESYEKIELEKKGGGENGGCGDGVAVVSRTHPRLREYRGVPNGEDHDDLGSGGGTPASLPNEPINSPHPLSDLSSAAVCEELGVQHHVLRKEIIGSSSIYTTAPPTEDRNFPDLVTSPPYSTRGYNSTTLPRSGAKAWYPRVSSSQSPLLASSREGSSPCDSSSRFFTTDSRSSSYYRLTSGCERSASSLNLYGTTSASSRNPWHHPSLPTSPVRPSRASFSLSSSNETPILNLLGQAAMKTGPSAYDYHAAQLERFLDEYRQLQEQLSRMKETCESLTKTGPTDRLGSPGLFDPSPHLVTPPAPDDPPKSILKNKTSSLSQDFFPSRMSPEAPELARYWATRNSIYNDVFH